MLPLLGTCHGNSYKISTWRHLIATPEVLGDINLRRRCLKALIDDTTEVEDQDSSDILETEQVHWALRDLQKKERSTLEFGTRHQEMLTIVH